MMEEAIKTERSMEKENKLDVKLSLTTENFIEIEKEEEQQQKLERSVIRRDNDNISNITNTNTQQKRQLQQAEMPQMHNNNNICKNTNSSSKRASFTNIHDFNTQQTMAAGTRCGEIFVTNNARKWTFVCTYCNKSTRDIGAFILHLKKMHLGGIYSDSASDDGDALSIDDGEDHIDERACNTSGHEQDVRNNRQMQQAMKYTYAGT